MTDRPPKVDIEEVNILLSEHIESSVDIGISILWDTTTDLEVTRIERDEAIKFLRIILQVESGKSARLHESEKQEAREFLTKMELKDK